MKQTILCALTLWALCSCSTNQTTAAFKGETASDLTVTTALAGWGAYVAAEHPGTNAEQQVFAAFKVTQSAELALIDATTALASNPAATNSATAAQNAFAASQLDFVNLVQSLTNLPAK